MARAAPSGSPGGARLDARRAIQLGLERYGAGDLEGAAEELRRALLLWPGSAPAQLYLGWVERCLRLGAPGAPSEQGPQGTSDASIGRAPEPEAGPVIALAPPPAALLMDDELPLDVEPGEFDLPPGTMAQGDGGIELELGDGEIDLSDLVAAAADLDRGQAPAGAPASALLADDLQLADEPLVPPAPAGPVGGTLSGLSLLLPGDAPPAGGLEISQLFSSAAAPATVANGSGLSDLLLDAPGVPGGGVEISQLFAAAVPVLAAGSGLSDLLRGEPAEGAGGISQLFAVEPAGPELLEEGDFELVAPTPEPQKSPLLAADLFAELESSPPTGRQRPLTARKAGGDTPDFVVEFEDIESVEPTSANETFPPPPPRQPALEQQLGQARQALDRGDADAAFRLAEEMIERAGGDPAAAGLRAYQMRLASLYEALLAPLDRVPRAGRMPKDLEPASAFLLSLLDGSMTMEEALTVSGMDRLRGARTLATLMRRGLLLM